MMLSRARWLIALWLPAVSLALASCSHNEPGEGAGQEPRLPFVEERLVPEHSGHVRPLIPRSGRQ